MSVFAGSYQPYPFWSPGTNTVGQWYLWDPTTPLTLSFPSDLPIGSLWFPVLTGAVQVYDGSEVTGTPAYTTQSNGSEVVPVDQGQLSVTLDSPGSSTMAVFVSSAFFAPTRLGPVQDQVSSVTASAPLTSSGGRTPNIALPTPISVADGGTGSTNPPGVTAGSGITVTGSFPDQQVSANISGLVSDVTATAPLSSTGGTTPNLTILNPLPLNYGGTAQSAPGVNPLPVGYGGTAQSAPGVVAGPGISITGTIFEPSTGASPWTINNAGVTSLYEETGDILVAGKNGITTSFAASTITIESDGTLIPVYTPTGVATTSWMVASQVSVNFSSGETVSTATVSLSGAAQFGNTNYSVVFGINSSTLPGTATLATVQLVTKTATSFGIQVTLNSAASGDQSVIIGFIATGN